MARKTTNKINEGERVSITIPRGDQRADPNYFISINGRNYIIPRGKAVDVPLDVAEEYYRAERAKEAFYATADELLEKAK